MNAKLKASMETAESILSEEGQDQLALIVDMFTANFQKNVVDEFNPEEYRELQRIAEEPFIKADQGKVDAIFAKHGL